MGGVHLTLGSDRGTEYKLLYQLCILQVVLCCMHVITSTSLYIFINVYMRSHNYVEYNNHLTNYTL